jgi:sodium/potassium-transporting ATPase subunit alpha
VHRFTIIITAIAVAWGVFLFVIGFVIGYSLVQNIQFGLGILVSMVPEGLPVTITISLSVTA